MRHYHVISGMSGYMPDRNEMFRTKREAIADAVWWKGEVLSDYWDDPEVKAYGSARSGGYTFSGNPGLEYIEVSECYEDDCLDDGEEYE